VLVLTWNLFHGRAVPPAGRDLTGDFAARLAGWPWDVALLQEVPPWWPPALARAAGAHAARTVLTSRNAGLRARRAIATRRPDLIRSNGGGANAILVRGEAVAEHRHRRLRWRPERRVVHAVRLASGAWVGNVHAQGHPGRSARDDIAAAGETLRAWAAGAPFVLGGDLNVRDAIVPGMTHAGGHAVDHVLASGLTAAAPARRR